MALVRMSAQAFAAPSLETASVASNAALPEPLLSAQHDAEQARAIRREPDLDAMGQTLRPASKQPVL